MAKYIPKPIIVEAEPYHRGLEDGFDFQDASYGFPYHGLTIDRYNSFDEKSQQQIKVMPYLKTTIGKQYIVSTDMIVTDSDSKYACGIEKFLKTHDLVKE
jgi:hypothetical protein